MPLYYRNTALSLRIASFVAYLAVSAEVQHRRHGAPAQVVGQRRPVAPDAVPAPGGRKGVAKAGVPVEHGATGVERQRLNALAIHGISTVAPSVLPDSMASCAFTASLSGYS